MNDNTESFTVFVIDRPYVSEGLRRTYFKKLEVYECTAKAETAWWGEEIRIVKTNFLHSYTPKKGWIKRARKQGPRDFTQVHKDRVVSTVNTHDRVFYTTLEAAQISKLLLIKQMEEKYLKALQELQDMFKRNVPDYKTPMSDLLNQYPELFL